MLEEADSKGPSLQKTDQSIQNGETCNSISMLPAIRIIVNTSYLKLKTLQQKKKERTDQIVIQVKDHNLQGTE